MIKNKCAWCGIGINNSETYYAKYGNACTTCNIRFSNVVRGVGKMITNNNGESVFKKDRDYTKQEIADMLQERIDEVKRSKRSNN